MTDELVRYESRAPAVVITLNRPDKRNALSRALIQALKDAFERAKDDAKVRCVILTGAGPAFCAGMDLAELAETLQQPAETAIWDDARRLMGLYDLIYSLPKPTIASVNGAAVAGGASRSLRVDSQGKALALALLQMPIEPGEDLNAMRRPIDKEKS